MVSVYVKQQLKKTERLPEMPSRWHYFLSSFYYVQICNALLSGLIKSGSSECLGVLMALTVLAKRFRRDASCVIYCFFGNCDCSFVGLVKHQVVSEEVLTEIEFQEVEEKGGLLHITLHCHHQNDSALTWAAI